MVIADDQRRYVDVNSAMCLLLRLPREAVLRMGIDDLTPPELRGERKQVWDAFMRDGVVRSGTYELQMPDGQRILVEGSAIANVQPGRHLSILMVPGVMTDLLLEPRAARQLSGREREVLTMVAMGESGATIARALSISPTTVETHVRNCLLKLEAKNRAHAIALGLTRGEIAMDFGSPRS
jgi:DNA-binding CsgD family transcriptional regulator